MTTILPNSKYDKDAITYTFIFLRNNRVKSGSKKYKALLLISRYQNFNILIGKLLLKNVLSRQLIKFEMRSSKIYLRLRQCFLGNLDIYRPCKPGMGGCLGKGTGTVTQSYRHSRERSSHNLDHAKKLR